MANNDLVDKQKEAQDPRRMVAKIAQAMGIDIDPDKYVAEVVRTGDKIIIPEGANLPDVIKSLQEEDEKERKKVSLNSTIAVPPWDGAMALNKAINEILGFAVAQEIPGGWFSADEPPTEIEVEYELGKTMTVRWGRFKLPGMDNAIAETGVMQDDTTGEFNFTAKITTVRRHQARARRILDRMREISMTESIHKGKAFQIQFHDADGDLIPIPTPKFFRFNRELPVFRKELQDAIERNIFTPIRHATELQQMGESLKRGVLFAGPYGTGKTMLASAIADYATQHEWTFIYVKDSAELPQALMYARKFQPVVVFAEDVDRIAGMERTDQVNNLLNQLDGVDSKSAQIMTILTSNHSNKVNAAMRRPGRIDMVLQVQPPDAETVTRMVKAFLGESLEKDANLTGIGEVLDGFAPAYVKEACGRARLEALRRTGNLKSLINGDDLATVAREVKSEKDLFTDSEPDDGTQERDGDALAKGFLAAGRIMENTIKNAKAGKVTVKG